MLTSIASYPAMVCVRSGPHVSMIQGAPEFASANPLYSGVPPSGRIHRRREVSVSQRSLVMNCSFAWLIPNHPSSSDSYFWRSSKARTRIVLGAVLAPVWMVITQPQLSRSSL